MQEKLISPQTLGLSAPTIADEDRKERVCLPDSEIKLDEFFPFLSSMPSALSSALGALELKQKQARTLWKRTMEVGIQLRISCKQPSNKLLNSKDQTAS